MKESFEELYKRLYNENFIKLEEKRKKDFKNVFNIFFVIPLICILRNVFLYDKSEFYLSFSNFLCAWIYYYINKCNNIK